MTTKFRVIAAGAVFLALSLFLYFTVRFDYVERDIIASLVVKTNRIVGEYGAMEKRLAGEKKAPGQDDLSGFLARVHEKNRDIALMAITDPGLTVRLSSKNDRFIRSSELFEAILKDFTQDAFNISRENPYAVRYYDEKTGGGAGQVKFYVFISRAGPYRLLIVYPYLFGGKILVRTALEVALVVACIVVIFAALYIALTKTPSRREKGDRYTINLDLRDRPASRGDGVVSRDAPATASDTLGGYVHELFRKAARAYGADSLSLYLSHSSGRLLKAMELNGTVFTGINSISFDAIDAEDEAGQEMRGGATMVMDDGRRVLVPLVYNGVFLGCVMMLKQAGLQGAEIRELKTAMAGIMKDIHDYLAVNDLMVDAATGLYNKIYFNLTFDESRKSWKGGGKIFSILLIGLFDAIGHIDDAQKNTVIRLVAPALVDRIKSRGVICRYDDYVAVILHGTGQRKARGLARGIMGSLARFRIRINADTTVGMAPLAGVASIDMPGADQDCLGIAMRQIRG